MAANYKEQFLAKEAEMNYTQYDQVCLPAIGTIQ